MNDSQDLISFISSMSGEGNLRVEENLGEGYVRLRVSEAERRQAKHDIQHVEDVVIEMLRNARDAGASTIYVATQKEAGVRTLVFLDDGCGVPADMQERIFDARVTSKLESMKMDRWGVHGRGMALFSIRQNVESASVVTSGEGLGSVFAVEVDTERLGERADQSTWPQAVKNEDGVYVCAKGPHNIVRTTCEFALEERSGCDVFFGTPTEVAATMYQRALSRVDTVKLLFVDDEKTVSVCDRLAFAADALDFMRISESLGLGLSERTAHRIIAGQIDALRPVAARLLRTRDSSSVSREIDLVKDRRGLRIAKEDLAEFSRSIEKDFSQLAERYYLNLAGDPKIRVSKDRITVSFEIDKQE